jgi:hypothetical protein
MDWAADVGDGLRVSPRACLASACGVQPTTTLTRVKATLTVDCPSIPPPREASAQIDVSSSHFRHLSDIQS